MHYFVLKPKQDYLISLTSWWFYACKYRRHGFDPSQVWNQLYKHSSMGKTPCVSITQWAGHLKKGQVWTPDANHEALHVRVNKALISVRKTEAPKRHRGNMQRYPKVYHHFGRKWSSPTDSRILRVSTITSLYKALWARSRHSHSSGVKSMNTSLKVNCVWNENTFHQQALRRVLIFTVKDQWDR